MSEIRREKKPSEYNELKDYTKDKMKKYYWGDKMKAIFGDFPKICPLSVEDNRFPPEYNSIEDAMKEINTARKCKLHNPEFDCECWFTSNPGRCDCWRVYWICSMFRNWLRSKEIGIAV